MSAFLVSREAHWRFQVSGLMIAREAPVTATASGFLCVKLRIDRERNSEHSARYGTRAVGSYPLY